MNIVDFDHSHIEQATELARANYQEEYLRFLTLPRMIEIPDMTGFAGNKLGMAAFENGDMVGFLCCYGPFDNAFRSTDARGVFSPIHGNGTVAKNRAAIYAGLYQAAAEKWARAGASSHGICLYVGDHTAQKQFFRYGFGQRCADAIRAMEPLDAPCCLGFEFVELALEERVLIYPLDVMLDEHMADSPTFIRRYTMTEDELARKIHESEDRYFAAKRNGKIIAFLKIGGHGETFIAQSPEMQNICGAFCLPDFRGRGVNQSLLCYAIGALKAEGYRFLGVDFESINPTAWGFWTKYFTPYTCGVVRRIDEHALGVVAADKKPPPRQQ